MWTDTELMRAITQRNPEALRQLYDRHSPIMLALGQRILRNLADSEDVLNEVFWELWDRPDRFDASRGKVRTFLLLKMRSRALDKLRTRITIRSDSANAAAATHSPDTHMETAEDREVVRQSLQRLSTEQRSAIELSFYEGLSHRDISERTGQPLGTIKSRIRNGLILLRDTLHTSLGGPR